MSESVDERLTRLEKTFDKVNEQIDRLLDDLIACGRFTAEEAAEIRARS